MKASLRPSRITSPTPLLQYPLASPSTISQEPVGERKEPRLSSEYIFEPVIKLSPPVTAVRHSPVRRVVHASLFCTETELDEQSVVAVGWAFLFEVVVQTAGSKKGTAGYVIHVDIPRRRVVGSLIKEYAVAVLSRQKTTSGRYSRPFSTLLIS